jgi:acetylglutamate kinase
VLSGGNFIPLVVKIGGSLEEEAPLDDLARYPGPMVLVHGGGPRIELWLDRLGLKSRFHQGLRVTPPEHLPIIEMALCALGKELADLLSRRGRPTVALSGRDAGLLRGQSLGEPWGRVGEVVEVNRSVVEGLLSFRLTPLISPLAIDSEGLLNVNADAVAGAVAGALGWPALFLTDVEGVLQDPKDPQSRLDRLSKAMAEELIERGVIQGGMIPKVRSALQAIDQGAPWSLILRGGQGALEAALKGARGTRFDA